MSNQTTTAPVEVQSMGKQAFVGFTDVICRPFGALVLVPLITGLNSNTALSYRRYRYTTFPTLYR